MTRTKKEQRQTAEAQAAWTDWEDGGRVGPPPRIAYSYRGELTVLPEGQTPMWIDEYVYYIVPPDAILIDRLYVPCHRGTRTPVVPFDCNPDSDDEGFLVYRSRAACEAACKHQSETYDCDCEPVALTDLEWGSEG